MSPCGRLRVTCALAPASMRALAVQHGPDRVDGRAGQAGEVGEGLVADLAVLAAGPAQDTSSSQDDVTPG